MAREEQNEGYIQAIGVGLRTGMEAARVMSKESADQILRTALARMAQASRDCARSHEQLAQVMEKGLKGDGDAVTTAVIEMIDAAQRCFLERERFDKVFSDTHREVAAFQKCSSLGGKA